MMEGVPPEAIIAMYRRLFHNLHVARGHKSHATAIVRGKQVGRPRIVNRERLRALLASGMGVSEAAREVGMTPSSVWRLKRQGKL